MIINIYKIELTILTIPEIIIFIARKIMIKIQYMALKIAWNYI